MDTHYMCADCNEGREHEHAALMMEARIAAERLAEHAEAEGVEPGHWFINFATREGQHIGMTVVRAHTYIGALRRSLELGVNPGGTCTISRLDIEEFAEIASETYERCIDRLVTHDEAVEFGWMS